MGMTFEGERRRPGMCCGCGDPTCGIGPFVRPCGEGGRETGPFASSNEDGYWRKVDAQYDVVLDVMIERWRNIRTGEWMRRAVRNEFDPRKAPSYWVDEGTTRREIRDAQFGVRDPEPVVSTPAVEPVSDEATSSLEKALSDYEQSLITDKV
jgi:hypothetical protein